MLSVEKEIGERLRQARESMGLSLENLQEKTKIQKSFITAIENGEFDKLPSPFYVRTYLRTYCKCVKIEPLHILRQYRKAEQAERGLTSVHQAITPEMLAQTQKMYQDGQITQNLGQTGAAGNSYLGDKPLARVARTKAHTALTIAKTPKPNQNTGLPRQERVRPSNQFTQTTQSTLGSSQLRPALEPSPKPKQQSNPNPRPTLELKRATMQEQLRTQQPEQVMKNETMPSSGKRRTSKNQKTTQYPAQLSRSVTAKESLTSSNPPILERSQLTADASSQDVTQMRKLSRRAVRGKRASGGFQFSWPNKKSTFILIASVVICIPLLWATVAAMADDDEPKNNESSTQTSQQETPETPIAKKDEPLDSAAKQEEIVLVNGSAGENTYEVSGTEQIKIQFEASGESWVQVRKQRPLQTTGFLDEATLQNGDRDQYTHNFADSNELWISLGIPASVTVTVNGKQINPAKLIQIKKK